MTKGCFLHLRVGEVGAPMQLRLRVYSGTVNVHVRDLLRMRQSNVFFVIFVFVFRVLFGCDKQTNDLNVIETGGQLFMHVKFAGN